MCESKLKNDRSSRKDIFHPSPPVPVPSPKYTEKANVMSRFAFFFKLVKNILYFNTECHQFVIDPVNGTWYDLKKNVEF
ncbi:hypothetical protein DCC39_07640 [Pueribacillus theae]|uniref:Uncharacterized protein n=1 Tax=Pueribacillus theae TaxID=2171751 RepID=A0A2U1K3M5_9BACI|nr:hypothetical protein DCC39_07640 [Pueribacillus theae]